MDEEMVKVIEGEEQQTYRCCRASGATLARHWNRGVRHGEEKLKFWVCANR